MNRAGFKQFMGENRRKAQASEYAQGSCGPLLEECHFSLEDDTARVHFGERSRQREKDADGHCSTRCEAKPVNGDSRSRWTAQTDSQARSNCEASLLTDEVDLGRDSDSDDLDLLPVARPANKPKCNVSKTSRLLKCCSPYWVPPKCTIM